MEGFFKKVAICIGLITLFHISKILFTVVIIFIVIRKIQNIDTLSKVKNLLGKINRKKPRRIRITLISVKKSAIKERVHKVKEVRLGSESYYSISLLKWCKPFTIRLVNFQSLVRFLRDISRFADSEDVEIYALIPLNTLFQDRPTLILIPTYKSYRFRSVVSKLDAVSSAITSYAVVRGFLWEFYSNGNSAGGVTRVSSCFISSTECNGK